MRSKLQVECTIASAIAAVMFVAADVRADPIVWDTVNAIAGGNGCTSTGPFPDTWFITAGNDLSVIFSRMGVDLTPETAVNTATTGCLVRIPITIASNVAISQLDQTLLWGYAKDLGTTGSVTARSTFCGRPTNPTSGYVGANVEGIEALIETTSVSYFAWPPAAPSCLGKPVNCLFYANLAVAGRRTDRAQDESIRIYGEDIEYEALFNWQHCP